LALRESVDGRVCGRARSAERFSCARPGAEYKIPVVGVIYQKQIQLQTSGHRQMHDLTEHVARIVSDSRLQSGLVHVFNLGSTGAIGIIEFEPGLQKDLPAVLDKLLPPSRDYGHEEAWHDGNGHSHLQATLLGPSVTVPVKDGRLVLGTWQQVFHLECDIKPRSRTIQVTVMGE
jgi:secondary thiamine-phosphate synthase enzyme